MSESCDSSYCLLFVSRYIIEENGDDKETERFARRLTTQEKVRLKFCLEKSEYDRLKSIHEELHEAKYVSTYVALHPINSPSLISLLE